MHLIASPRMYEDPNLVNNEHCINGGAPFRKVGNALATRAFY